MSKNDETTRAVLLHSGGLDSTVLGLHLNEESIDFTSLFINYEQTAQIPELESFQITSSMLGVSSDVLDLSGLKSIFTSSQFANFDLVGNPGRHVIQLGSPVLLSQALTYARHMRMNTVYIGYTKLDADYSPEYTQEFLDMFSSLSEVAGYSRINFIAPFVDKTKAEVVSIGAGNPDLLAHTWTCHLNGSLQCGRCESCNGRQKAFQVAGVDDLTKYTLAA